MVIGNMPHLPFGNTSTFVDNDCDKETEDNSLERFTQETVHNTPLRMRVAMTEFYWSRGIPPRRLSRMRSSSGKFLGIYDTR